MNLTLIAIVAAALGAGLYFMLQTTEPEAAGYVELVLEAQTDSNLSSDQSQQILQDIISVYESRPC